MAEQRDVVAAGREFLEPIRRAVRALVSTASGVTTTEPHAGDPDPGGFGDE